ncbi:hypothetical protein BDP27DRAFT_1432453 [Rhodocollybia butyracea]|uniref:Uncharacterized protein n=1 Tax=Rhodocollybia butyracea TaxID=206335 RepID=A0A9P5TXZ2_9AGAR|nr:hypothetical protein BDP27DRAFT_1432453 [Rhodocollybia butyracea]
MGLRGGFQNLGRWYLLSTASSPSVLSFLASISPSLFTGLNADEIESGLNKVCEPRARRPRHSHYCVHVAYNGYGITRANLHWSLAITSKFVF